MLTLGTGNVRSVIWFIVIYIQKGVFNLAFPNISAFKTPTFCYGRSFLYLTSIFTNILLLVADHSM